MLFFLTKYYFQFRVLYTRLANFLLKKTIEDTVRIRHLTIFKKLFIDQRNVYVLGIAKEYEIEGRLTDVARLQNDYTCFAEGTSFV